MISKEMKEVLSKFDCTPLESMREIMVHFEQESMWAQIRLKGIRKREHLNAKTLNDAKFKAIKLGILYAYAERLYNSAYNGGE